MSSPLLVINGLTAHYGAAQALFGINLSVNEGETVALVGANGAGKTTLLKCLMGLLTPSAGEVLLDGVAVTGASPARMVRKGLALTPEGREVFPHLTVRENLELGAVALKIGRKEVFTRMQAVYGRFERLRERQTQAAGTLSGGEQQMLAMGRALMAHPRLLLLDEPSLGLAPLITDEIFAIIHSLARSGVTILLVEQNAARALSASDKAFLMAGGRIVEQGRSSDLLNDSKLRIAFLGAASDEKPEASRLGAAGLTNIRLEKPLMNQLSLMPDFQDEEALAAHQLKGLQWTVRHAFEGSSFYRQRLEQAGITPDAVCSLADLTRLPFTTTDNLREFYPFPLRSVPFEQIVRVHASSGTTGKRKILGYTQKDIDDWVHFFARCYAMAGVTPLDRVQIAVGYGIWTAGMGFQLGCEKIGAMAVPVGPGNIDMHLQFMQDLRSTVFCSTASMALLMAEEIHRRAIADKIHIRKIIYGSERTSRSMRRKISELFGGAELFDITGLTELYGPGTGIECPNHDCIHYWGDYYILEIVDPETLQPLPPGEWGEMVVTTLAKEAAPLIRYRTRDITRIIPGRCTCGSIMPRHSRIKGRSDDTIKFRGVNIYPSTIDTILSAIPGLGSEYQIHLTRDESSGRDTMKVFIERGEGVDRQRSHELIHEITYQVKRQMLVSVDVELVDYGHLPRSERKSQRVFDTRITDEIV
ncbi:MAG: ATP-binding cassette domain-containing protein [Desulfobacterales bacterium]|jgi:phenylacetate-coenzyme A ligase PaaK-like adenylate-forming protein/ABC-type branched-subunit amino acid transport system ATPase component|nr:ATP-binding cassette domain-containing protein [Desulfobacterales bacterium]